MPKVSISEAARLAGIARSNFYTTYIKKGRISVTADPAGKKSIDISELLRVFPDIKQDSRTGQQDNAEVGQPVQDRTGDKSSIGKEQLLAENELLKAKLSASETRVDELQSDKQWFKQQIATAEARAAQAEVKLLEHLSPSDPPDSREPDPELKALLDELSQPKAWWQFWK